VGAGLADRRVESGQQFGAGRRSVRLEVVVPSYRLACRLPDGRGESAEPVLVGGPDLGCGQTDTGGESLEQLATGVGRDLRRLLIRPRVGQEPVVDPQRFAVGAPEEPDLPAGQGFSRVPLALTALNQPVGSPRRLEPGGE
jgi:hypothetical protein